MTSSFMAIPLRLVMAAAVLLAFSSACSDENTPAVAPETPCQTSADCDGGLCLLNLCRECVSDEVCADDESYGLGATCTDGVCQSCRGASGCACAQDDTCDEDLVCRDDVCEACPTGEQDCPCFGNETCTPGLACTEGLCVAQDCPPGERGCLCNEGGLCGEGLVCMETLCVPEDCALGELGCPCLDDDEAPCAEGFACAGDGMCAECTPEFEHCPCDEEGECAGDLICDDEEETCRPPSECADLPCVENQLCQAGEPGLDARCLEACVDGFEFNLDTGACEEVVVVFANCREGDQGSILDECGAQNRRCVEDDMTAACGECLTDFIPDGESCRAALTCAGLGCGAVNRACTAHTDTSDALCAGCLMGFEENESVCEPIPQANCQPDAPLSILADCNAQSRLCVESDGGAECGGCFEDHGLDPDTQTCVRRLCEDIGCEGLGRTCEGDPLAECGDCVEGAIPSDVNDPFSQCRDPLGCQDLECAEGELCVLRDGRDATCADWPCLDVNDEPDFNQALREDTNACVECGLLCNEEEAGLTGRIWPTTLVNSNRCICETEQGFYFDISGAFTALPCDDDNDGWVRSSARDVIESGDPALEANARCALKIIDRVTLENEYQQRLDVHLCDEGTVAGFDCDDEEDCGENGRCNFETGQCECTIPTVVDLYESVRNDDQDELDESNVLDVPVYTNEQDRGRQLRASELNPLTRACITTSGDYNDNGIGDLSEWQGMEPDGADADTIRFLQFGHFVELHEGFYEDIIGSDIDRYVVREKSRCEPDFPIEPDEARDGLHWQSCTRNRDAGFDSSEENALIGYDFATWVCQSDEGTCTMPPPLVDVTPDGEVPPHGLCDPEVTLPPADGVWRGMNHHSQFKCIHVVDTLPDDRDAQAPHQRLLAELASDEGQGTYQLSRCGVACPDGDANCEQDCGGEGCEASSLNSEGNPDRPLIQCSPVNREAVDEDEVGFAAVRYIDSPGLYTLGCIDEFTPSVNEAEATPWKNLCPGYAQNPDGVVGQGNPGNFGLIVCGCGFNYGGPNCDEGCVTTELHYGGNTEGDTCSGGYCPVFADDDGGGRRGYWMCGGLSTVSYEGTDEDLRPALRGGVWAMEGEVSAQGIEKHSLCQDEACESGWSLR